MKNTYDVILKWGVFEDTYIVEAKTEEEAIILAQAEAIKLDKGYKLVKVDKTISL